MNTETYLSHFSASNLCETNGEDKQQNDLFIEFKVSLVLFGGFRHILNPLVSNHLISLSNAIWIEWLV